MPEIISKQPELVIAVLKEARLNCGTGAKQNILTACPKDQFCALPDGKGELCVYAPHKIGSMRQMTSFDFMSYDLILPMAAIAVMIFLAGVMTGLKAK